MAADDHDLHRLIGDAVSDVHPHDGAERIRTRTAGTTSRGRTPAILAAAVATVAVIGGTAWFADHDPGTQVTGPSAPSSQEPSADATLAPAESVDVVVYAVGSTPAGPRLFPEPRRVEATREQALQAAVDQALSATPTDPDHSDALSTQGVTADASLEDGQVRLDLSAPLERGSMSAEEAEVALQSLVWTADRAADSQEPVRFSVGGEPVEELLGVDTSDPVERAGEDSVLSPVSITSPGEGATLPTTFEVTGSASTYEGTVVWELKRGDTVARSGYATTDEAFVQSPYSFEVSATPGDYTLVVHDTDESDGEGVGITEDTKEITVRTGF